MKHTTINLSEEEKRALKDISKKEIGGKGSIIGGIRILIKKYGKEQRYD